VFIIIKFTGIELASYGLALIITVDSGFI